MTCDRCGAQLPAEARFCSSCGTPSTLTTDERRVVTVVFADLSGFTQMSERLDPEQVKAIVDRAARRLSVVVERYGGRVDKVIGDELMAVFGAPEAHEDDPERALRCAFAMRAELEAMSSDPGMPPLTMHVGMNTGEVVAGNVGGREYTILGDAVNTARRIQEAARPGQILVARSTRDQAQHAASFRNVEPLQAKGKSEPLEVFEALAEKGLPGRITLLETPLIGRREEMHLITLAGVIAERDRKPSIVTIVGEAGMGKSKIASEVAAGAARLDLPVMSARSLPYATMSSGFALEQLIRQALDLDEHHDQAAQVRAAMADLDLAGEAEVALGFLGVGHDTALRSTGGAPGAGAVPSLKRSVQTCARILVRSARSKGLTVCILNDLQWAEDLVLDALWELATAEDAPLLIVALARPALLEQPPAYLSRPGSLLLRLGPLSVERSAEILDVLAPDLRPHVRDRIIERAGGNPFFLEELARSLRGSEDAARPIPPTIHALIAAKLDQLPATDKRLLQLASVPPSSVSAAVLARMASLPEDQVLETCQALQQQGLLDEQRPQVFAFQQKLVREVAYSSMPKAARIDAHISYGELLSAEGEASVDEIAYTFERAAGLSQQMGIRNDAAALSAREALIEVAVAALARDAATTAVSLLDRAAELTDEPLPLDARIAHGEALLGVLRHEEAARSLDSALQEARRDGDHRSEGRALRLIGDALRMRGSHEEARDAIERALDLAQKHGTPEDVISAQRSRGLLDLFRGDYREASDSFRRALENAERADDPRGQGWALQNLGWTLMVAGRQLEAIEAFERGEAIFAQLEDHEGRGWSMGMRAWSLLMLERVDESVALMREVEELVTETFPGDDANLVMARRIVRILDCYVAIARADLGTAESMSLQILTEPEWHGVDWAHALAAYPLALSALLQERPRTARDAIERGLRAARKGDDPFYLGLYSMAEAWLNLLEGDPEAAASKLERIGADQQAGRGWQRSGTLTWLRARIDGSIDALSAGISALTGEGSSEGITVLPKAFMVADLAVQLAPSDLEAAKDAVATARRAASGFAIGHLSATLADAQIHLAAGDRNEALEAVSEALDALKDASFPLAEARAQALLAAILDARREHDRADEAFEKAKLLFEALPEDTLAEARGPQRL